MYKEIHQAAYDRSDRDVESVRKFLLSQGLTFCLFVPTKNDFNKSSFVATEPIRSLLKNSGLFDFDDQPTGEYSYISTSLFLFNKATGHKSTPASLYRSPTGDGRHKRMWISDLNNYSKPGNLIAAFESKGSLIVINTSDIEIWENFKTTLSFPRRKIADHIFDDNTPMEEKTSATPEEFLEKTYKLIRQRRGQPAFRKMLLDSYNSQCAISDCNGAEALEACHIKPYSISGNNSVNNGLLLRSDLHTLFDLGLILINPETYSVEIADSLTKTSYLKYQNSKLKLPNKLQDYPCREFLQWHYGI